MGQVLCPVQGDPSPRGGVHKSSAAEETQELRAAMCLQVSLGSVLPGALPWVVGKHPGLGTQGLVQTPKGRAQVPSAPQSAAVTQSLQGSARHLVPAASERSQPQFTCSGMEPRRG